MYEVRWMVMFSVCSPTGRGGISHGLWSQVPSLVSGPRSSKGRGYPSFWFQVLSWGWGGGTPVLVLAGGGGGDGRGTWSGPRGGGEGYPSQVPRQSTPPPPARTRTGVLPPGQHTSWTGYEYPLVLTRSTTFPRQDLDRTRGYPQTESWTEPVTGSGTGLGYLTPSRSSEKQTKNSIFPSYYAMNCGIQ